MLENRWYSILIVSKNSILIILKSSLRWRVIHGISFQASWVKVWFIIGFCDCVEHLYNYLWGLINKVLIYNELLFSLKFKFPCSQSIFSLKWKFLLSQRLFSVKFKIPFSQPLFLENLNSPFSQTLFFFFVKFNNKSWKK